MLVDFTNSRIQVDEDGPRSTLERISSTFRGFRSTSTAKLSADTPLEGESDLEVASRSTSTAAELWKVAADVEETQYSLESMTALLDQLVDNSRTALSLASSVLKAGDSTTNHEQRLQEVGRLSYLVETPRSNA
jgi:hypothetical protein